MTDATGKLGSWCLQLPEFDFEIAHRAGVKYQAAEALSRVRKTGMDESLLEDDVTELKIAMAQPEG